MRTSRIIFGLVGCVLAGFSLIIFFAVFPISAAYLAESLRTSLGLESYGFAAVPFAYLIGLVALLFGSFASLVNSRFGGACMFGAGVLALPVVDVMAPLNIGLILCGCLLYASNEPEAGSTDYHKVDHPDT